MTENANRILECFEQLAPGEQHAVVVSLLRLAGELPSAPLTDDELCGIAGELFASLDDDENDDYCSESR